MNRSVLLKASGLYLGGFLLLMLMSFIHLTQGQADYSFQALLTEVWQPGRVQDIVVGLRLPRVVIGILAGGALAVAGLFLQTLTKNPLASAGTLGINAGAYFFVVVFTIFMPSLIGKHPFVVSLLGAAFAAIVVMTLVGRTMDPVRVALTGMIISLLFSSFTGTLQLFYENETNGLFLWGSGTLIQLDWSGVRFAVLFVIGGAFLAILLGSKLDVLTLGDDVATSLGQSVTKVKLLAWGTAILLAASTVSVVGPIGFVGLMAPHIVRFLGVKGHRGLVLHSFLWGAILLVGADVLARLLTPNQEMPVGAMTAIIGGPWLMFLAYRAGKQYQKSDTRLGGYEIPVPFFALISLLTVLLATVLFLAISFGGTAFLTLEEWLNGSIFSTFIVNFRIPRVLTAFVVGMLLAMSGVLLQGVLRNPLADPSVLGITSGGGAGAMIFLVVFPAASVKLLPFAALAGSLLAMTIILLATRKSKWNPVLLALVGVALSAVGSAIIQILIVRAKLGVAPALTWLAGSTYGKGWEDLRIVALVALVAIPITVLLVRRLDVLSFGDDVAMGLGLRVSGTKIIAIFLGVAMGAASVSVVGTIGFIGLLAPHIARRMVGVEHKKVIIISLFIGGILLVAADFLGRLLLAPKEIPSGLVVALIGTPYLLYLLRKI
ncbi:Vitamin B12 import system permease protein BtuC [Lentibacillus sp. JNUCC-1]|uniref:Fe(3+)-hydroxamate ABC transporter permease FhuB n=1 Tax=Lentibacillus sp. JNUCC-1 TaxID=2654513 RepID=UPI0012E77A14|nr:Fe(3+)-hydroxamate ABC transporter permease FhuB [Lentibacillus sp. JNUCC-1]MUV37738.1 Vitamin B12 import system permease protein BtuC [Lentibacillus sp. JNUCC-1]